MPSIFLHIDGCRKIIEKKKFFKRKPDAQTLALIGSLIPDLELLGVLKKVHGRCKEFYDYLEMRDKAYLPLAFGMIVHEHHDNLIETHFVGEHEESARELLEQYDHNISKIGVAPEILIEHSLDCSLLEEKPELIDFTKKIVKRVKRSHFKNIAKHLADFFDGDEKQIAFTLRMFRRFYLHKLAADRDMTALWQKYMFFISQNNAVTYSGVRGKLFKMKVKLAINYMYGKKMLNNKKKHAEKILLKAKKKFNHSSLLKHAHINEEKLLKLPFELL